MKYLIIVFFALSSCSSIAQAPQNAKLVLIPKSKKEYKYKIDNKNIEGFGYKVAKEDGTITAATSILIDGKFTYIMDPVHHSIKKIDMETGKISNINLPNPSQDFPGIIIDFTMFNGNFYILRLDEYVDVLTKDCNFVKRIKLPSQENNVRYFGGKCITELTDSSFEIQLEADDIQNKDYSFTRYFTTVYKNDVVKRDSARIKKFDYDQIKGSSVRGKRFSIEKATNIYLLKTASNTYQIPSIPQLEYWGNNVLDFSGNTVVTFYCNEKELVLNVYEY